MSKTPSYRLTRSRKQRGRPGEKLLRKAREIELMKRQAQEDFNALMCSLEILIDELRMRPK